MLTGHVYGLWPIYLTRQGPLSALFAAVFPRTGTGPRSDEAPMGVGVVNDLGGCAQEAAAKSMCTPGKGKAERACPVHAPQSHDAD